MIYFIVEGRLWGEFSIRLLYGELIPKIRDAPQHTICSTLASESLL